MSSRFQRSLLFFLLLISNTVFASRPNVLFITVDDMNRDSVGAFGCLIPGITPNIDRLAEEGVKFEHAHVTIAICQPTRAVWMTGRYPHRSGALGFNPINRGVPTLLETLHDAGYYTGIMAKVPHVVPSRGKAWEYVVQASQLKTGRDPNLYYEHAKQFFDAAGKEKRSFFLMANSQDPHRPFAGSRQETGRGNARNARRGNENFPGVSKIYSPDEVLVPGFLPDLPEIRQELSEYFTSVHRADEIVGAVLKALDESGLRDNTLVMFKSDHGMPLPFAKTNCWLHSTATPWIVRWPGVVKPGRSDAEHMIAGIDFAPTILEAAGLEPLEGMDGRSFLPVLRGQKQSGRDAVFTSINGTAGKNEYPMRSVVTKSRGYIFNAWSNGETVFKNESQSGLTMKAMRNAARTDPEIAARVQHFLYRTPEEFYDYENDPSALRNLIDDPKYQTEIQSFRRQLREQMTATGDDAVLNAFDAMVKIE
ncbi:MAG TPA: sulfatase [Planctomycetaceae bacterium]|nr:sulfatase [Planctomycetaceae bacterium]